MSNATTIGPAATADDVQPPPTYCNHRVRIVPDHEPWLDGESAQLRCGVRFRSSKARLTVNGGRHIRWQFLGLDRTVRQQAATADGRIRQVNDLSPDTVALSVLHFAVLRLSDSGLYTCLVETGADVARQTLGLQVHVGPPTFADGQRRLVETDKRLVVGERLELHCTPSGSTTRVHWTRDGRNLTTAAAADERYYTASAPARPGEPVRHTLRVDQVQLDDAGVYGCVATNAKGEAQLRVRVDVRALAQPTTTTDVADAAVVSIHNNDAIVGIGILLMLVLVSCVVAGVRLAMRRRRRHVQQVNILQL